MIGKEVYLDVDDEDYRLLKAKCKIISIDENFVKLQFRDGKKTITKLLDMNLVYSFKIVEKKER